MALKILLSPAKKLNFDIEVPSLDYKQPSLWASTEKLSRHLKKLSVKKISELMSLSKDLSELNYHRYQEFKVNQDASISKPAILVFDGEVYNGLKARTFNLETLKKADQNLFILSGLYGILSALDFIQPYRLEMGTSLAIGKKKNLYQFWDKQITHALLEKLDKEDVIVNLASNEYFKALNTKLIPNAIVTPVFKEYKDGVYKTVMVYAKNARGAMANYILSNNIAHTQDLKGFSENGYSFMENLSSEKEWFFVR